MKNQKTNTKKQATKKTAPTPTPTTTVSQCRGLFFCKNTDIVYKNQWEELIIKNKRLDIVHQNIVTAIIKKQKRINKFTDGSVGILFEPYSVLKFLGFKKPGGADYQWLENKLDDLATTLAILKTQKFETHFTVVRKHRKSTILNENANTKNNNFNRAVGSYFHGVIFEPEFWNFFKMDENIAMSDIFFQDMLSFPPNIQKFIMLVVSNRQFNFFLSDVVKITSPGIKNTREIKGKIVKNKEILEQKFGIAIKKTDGNKDYTVLYRQHNQIFITSPGKK